MTPSSSPFPALTAASQEALASLLASGWRPIYSPFCQAWWFRQGARGWVTSVYVDVNKAIAAAASVEALSLATEAERAARKERLRRELRG